MGNSLGGTHAALLDNLTLIPLRALWAPVQHIPAWLPLDLGAIMW